MDNGIVQIGTGIIALLGAVITYIVIPYFKSKTTAEQQQNIYFWVDVAVTAAEQAIKGSGLGDQKKQFVIDFLNKKGIKISSDQLDALIEAAVYQLNESKKQL